MKYDSETCLAMMWKYARWWKRAFEAGDCFAKFYSDEWRLWYDRWLTAICADFASALNAAGGAA